MYLYTILETNLPAYSEMPEFWIKVMTYPYGHVFEGGVEISIQSANPKFAFSIELSKEGLFNLLKREIEQK